MNAQKFDHEYDVVVVGSGNGALVAAVVAHDSGAKVLVIEKSDMYGGTSATSGGGVWIPNNRYAIEAGADDSLDDARTYIKHVSPLGVISDEMIETYIRQGPKMIDYLHDKTQCRYVTLPHYPDYFPEDPGGRHGHRSMEPEPLDGNLLKKDLFKLRPQHVQTTMPGGINFTQVEGQVLLGALTGWRGLMAKRIFTYLFDFPFRFKSRRDRRLTMGNAGVARLRLSMQERDIPLWLSAPMQELITEGDRVVGVVTEQEGRQVRIGARKGVVLASGGFERNQQMREEYLPSPTDTSWSAANMYNTGDGLRAALALGADIAQMEVAWWTTVMKVPGEEKARLSLVEKSLPGNYVVDRNGERFSNESQNYVSFVNEMYAAHAKGRPCIPCYMVFDADFRAKRPCGPLVQGSMMPDWMVSKSWWDPSFLTKADSLRELAEKVGINPAGLEATAEKVNRYAADGNDLDLSRGNDAYDRYYGDPTVKPNPCLAPLAKPPFYCMPLYPGEMGTAGGLAIDPKGRVLRKEDRQPIPGLWACGNITAALLPRYPGPGATLGPSMTWGYLAARDIMGVNE